MFEVVAIRARLTRDVKSREETWNAWGADNKARELTTCRRTTKDIKDGHNKQSWLSAFSFFFVVSFFHCICFLLFPYIFAFLFSSFLFLLSFSSHCLIFVFFLFLLFYFAFFFNFCFLSNVLFVSSSIPFFLYFVVFIYSFF